MGDLTTQYEFLYNLFREHYTFMSDKTQRLLDKLMYECSKHIRERELDNTVVGKLDATGKMNNLIKRFNHDLKGSITTFLLDYISIFNKQYTEVFGLVMPSGTMSESWKTISDYFTKYCASYCQTLTEVLATVETTNDFYQLFPIAKNEGKLHSRLKTLCYMGMLTATNQFCNSILKYNNKKPVIFSPEEKTHLLSPENNIYSLPVEEGEQEKYIWEYTDQAIRGYLPPSRYGSHELLFPSF